MPTPQDALRYVRLHLRPIPLRGKVPVKKAWQRAPMPTEAQAASFWRDSVTNVGIAVPAGMIVLDMDNSKGKCGDGELACIEAEYGSLPHTWEAYTGGGGRHLWFRLPDGMKLGNGRGTLPVGIDVRGAGGQVVVEPSIHPDTGEPYRWIVAPEECRPAEAPAWLLAIIGTKKTKPGRPKATPANPPPRPGAGDRIERARRYLDRVPPAVQGQNGHDATVNCTWHVAVGFDLEPGEALAALADWNGRCSPPWSEAELVTMLEGARRRAAGGDLGFHLAEPPPGGNGHRRDTAVHMSAPAGYDTLPDDPGDDRFPPPPAPDNDPGCGPPPPPPRPDTEPAADGDWPPFWVRTKGGYYARLGGAWEECDRIGILGAIGRAYPDLGPKERRDRADNLPLTRGAAFRPGDPRRVVLATGGIAELNTYEPLPRPAADSATGDGASALLALCDHLFGHDREWALDWLARPLQALHAGRPGHRNYTAMVLYGPQGSGKGLLCRLLGKLYGRHYVAIDHGAVDSKFAPLELPEALLVLCDEVASRGETSGAETLFKLKAWITEPRIHLDRKHHDSRSRPAYFNLIFASNSPQPMTLEESDRRYAFFEQSAPLSGSLLHALEAEADAGFPSAGVFLDLLLARPVAMDHPKPPHNDARNRQMHLSASAYTAFCDELVATGLLNLASPWIAEREAIEKAALHWTAATADGKGHVEQARLAQFFSWWCRVQGYHGSPRKLWAEMERRIPGTRARDRAVIGGIRTRTVSGVPLTVADAPTRLPNPTAAGCIH